MNEVEIPTYVLMMAPTLHSLDALGGSATKDELDAAVIARMGLSDQQLAVEFPEDSRQRGSKVVHRLAWARTYLKKLGYVTNSQRGVWTILPTSRDILSLDLDEANKALRRQDSDVRRAMRLERLAKAEEEAPEGDTDVEDHGVVGEESEAPGWQAAVLRELRAMEPSAFERLTQRLLREAGFRNVEVLGKSGDGGLDVVGVYRVSLVSFTVFCQCKRYQGSVGSGAVRDFRGAMSGRGEKGLLITTGSFTADAVKEAARDGAPPVELIDAAALCDLLKEYGLGVSTRVRQVEEVEVEPSYFASL